MRRILFILFSFTFVLSAPASTLALSDNGLILTDDQINIIQENCSISQSILKQVHSYDALTRVNMGQRYENISTRVMAPFISRVALNGFDSVELASTSVAYKKQIKDFADRYITYESTVSEALAIDCKNDPIRYYSTIVTARNLRNAVYESVSQLNSLLRQYKTNIDAVAKVHGWL